MSDSWVTGRKPVAEQLKVDVRSVANWKKEDWWLPSFQKGNRYNVEAIRKARDASRAKPGDELQELRAQLRVAKEQEELEQLQAETRRRKRAEARELNQTLPADVYAEFIREWLAMCRDAFETLPYEIARSVPPALQKHLYNEDSKRPAKLQKLVAKKLLKLQQWLADGEKETANSNGK